MDKPIVFISYSHEDEEWKNRLLPHLRLLEKIGHISIWDDRKIDPGGEWFNEIQNVMDRATVALCLISADYLASDFCNKEEIPHLLKRREHEGLNIVPLLLRKCFWKAVPWLRDIQMLPRDGKSVANDYKGDEDKVFAEVAEHIYNIVSNPNYHRPVSQPRWPPPIAVDLHHLPVSDSYVFGRQSELDLLDHVWNTSRYNIVSFFAWGGVGKTTLINKWLESMAADNYRGAKKVYGWSFYSQGTREQVTSADQFINEALVWFGDEQPEKGSPWDKGERLAGLIRREKTLLLLDGMEPLQSSFSYEHGKIKDPALAIFLAELARDNPGLCIITTRVPVVGLAQSSKTTFQKNLEQVSTEAGRALLRIGGVRGTDQELEEATRNFGHHALALSLLATYLGEIPGHHISAAAAIPDLDLPLEAGRHPRRVIKAFEARFARRPEIELLRILGLFDRPAKSEEIDAVRAAPPIRNLTSRIQRLSEVKWLNLIEGLRDLKLIARKSKHQPRVIDAHPIVREHFADQLKQQYPQAWREGNDRLYEYLKRASKELPENIDEMAPLYAAVAHGCEAGKHQSALDEVYWRRILRGDDSLITKKHGAFEEFFSTKKLGAFGYDLAALRGFFDDPWQQPVNNLREADRAFVLNQAGFRLRALGRMREAIAPIRGSLDSHRSLEDWEYAAIDAGHLSHLFLMVGELEEAIHYAHESIELADKSLDDFWRVRQRTTLGNALHHAGRLAESEVAFQAAEQMQEGIFQAAKQRGEKTRFELPILYSLWGFHYCDLLLSAGRYEDVRTRAARTLEWALPRTYPRDIGLDNLAIGLAWLLEAKRDASDDFTKAAFHLKTAVDVLRNAGYLDYLLRGLLARAELHLLIGDLIHAQVDLDEAISITTRGGMSLLQADCHLGYARLFLAQADREKAQESFDAAQEMIRRMGYYRRNEDLSLLARQLGSPVNRV